jgi:hypothetical protein
MPKEITYNSLFNSHNKKKGVILMAKRNGKTDAEQKNKQGFDSSKTDSEFGKEFGSAAANRAHKEKAKKLKSSKNQGEWKGMN